MAVTVSEWSSGQNSAAALPARLWIVNDCSRRGRGGASNLLVPLSILILVAETRKAPLTRRFLNDKGSPAAQPPGSTRIAASSPCPCVATSKSLIATVAPACSVVHPEPEPGRFHRNGTKFGMMVKLIAVSNCVSSAAVPFAVTTRLAGGQARQRPLVGDQAFKALISVTVLRAISSNAGPALRSISWLGATGLK